MNAFNKNIHRIVSSLLLSSIILQPFSSLAFADESNQLSSVDILQLEGAGNSVKVHFSPLAEGITVTARVDQEGKGDFLTIQSALAQVKSGVIAVSSGTYQEHDLVVPEGVILRGGYDNRTWAISSNMTTLAVPPSSTGVVLQNSSGIQHLVILGGSTGVRIANGPASINQVVVSNAKLAVDVSSYAYTRIAYSDFIKNEAVIGGEINSKVFIVGSIFQNNATTVSKPLDTESFIQDSTFFPQKNSLQNIHDQNNVVANNIPLANAEWQFPEDRGGKQINQNFDFTRTTDNRPQTLAGPTIQDTTDINAINLYYQISQGDELKIVDRSNFSTLVFSTKDQPQEFNGWIALPKSTKELKLLLETNGDGSLPLQIGVSATATIPSLDYNGVNDRGIMSNNPDAALFYRQPIIMLHTPLNTDAQQKLTAIDRPSIQAGDEWIKGSDIDGTNSQTVANYKGYVTKALINKQSNEDSIAFNNFSQSARAENDSRETVLLNDYLQFKKPTILERDSCRLETQCPLPSTGLKEFLPIASYSLRSEDNATHNERGLYNSEGWNIPADSIARLVVTLPQTLSQLVASWNLQPYIVNPTGNAHILGFFNSKTRENELNSIDVFLTPDGNIEIKALDHLGQAITHRTSNLNWNSGKKYQMVLTLEQDKVFLSRDDGVTLWQQNADFEGIDQVIAGANDPHQKALPAVLSDFKLWQNPSASHTFGAAESDQLNAALASEERSIAGSITFSGGSICGPNGLTVNEGTESFISITGTRQNSNCNLTLSSPLLTTPAKTSVALSELASQLTLIWQWNSIANQGTLGLYNSNGVILASMPEYGSSPIKRAFGPRNINLRTSSRQNSLSVQYKLLPTTTIQSLIKMVGVERYEVLYSDKETEVKNGTAANIAVTVEDLQASSNPQKVIGNLQTGKRYFFAVRAILENGGSTETTHSRDIFLHDDASQNTLEIGSQAAVNLPTTLALANSQNYQVAYAQQDQSGATHVDGGSVLPGHLAEALNLTNTGNGNNSFTAWSLGKDLSMTSNSKPQHIYTVAGQYIVSQIRTLTDGNIVKQFTFIAVGDQSSATPKISAEIWTSNKSDPSANWSSKTIGKKIPALVGINEPFYLLGQATDVTGSKDNAYTWHYQVDWGDGTSDNSPAVNNAFNQTRLVNRQKEETPLTHRYARPGIYTIVSQVTDDRNNTNAFENTVIVSGPEVSPQKITSLAGIGRILTISGGTAPYTVHLPDDSEQTLTNGQKTFVLPITQSGTVNITDRFNNTTSVEITVTSDPKDNLQEIYLANDRALIATPNSLKTNEVVNIESHGEDGLNLNTQSLVFNFGDALPGYLVDALPSLDTAVTFGTESATKTGPFLTMGVYPAVLTSVDKNGKENKKAFTLDIGTARLGSQSNSGIITGSVPPAFHSIPNSVEIWQRGGNPVRLASLTPNANGRFVYIVPNNQKSEGVVTIVINDQKGASTEFPQNIQYSFKNRPHELFGLLETNGNSPLFTNTNKLATNALKPTFFGVDTLGQQKTIRIASDNPQEYPLVKNGGNDWIVESKATLAEGEHVFSVLGSSQEILKEYHFTVDRTAPAKPTISYASWSQLQGKTEPFSYIGVVAEGQENEEKYVQADVEGNFHINFVHSNNQYTLAAADEAGNVSPLLQINQSGWETTNSLTLWQKMRPYLWWSLLVALAATGITYARRSKL